MVLVLQRRVLVMDTRIILRSAIPIDSNIGGLGHRPLLERLELAFCSLLFSLVLSLLFALGSPRVLLLSCFVLFLPPFGLHSFDLGLGIGGRAVQPGSRAVPPLVPGCAVPMGLHSVFGRFHRSNPW